MIRHISAKSEGPRATTAEITGVQIRQNSHFFTNDIFLQILLTSAKTFFSISINDYIDQKSMS